VKLAKKIGARNGVGGVGDKRRAAAPSAASAKCQAGKRGAAASENEEINEIEISVCRNGEKAAAMHRYRKEAETQLRHEA